MIKDWRSNIYFDGESFLDQGTAAPAPEVKIAASWNFIDSTGIQTWLEYTNPPAAAAVTSVTGSGHTIQAAQRSSGLGIVPILGIGSTIQDRQQSVGAGNIAVPEKPETEPITVAGYGVGRRPEKKKPITGSGESLQQPQYSDGIGHTTLSGTGTTTQQMQFSRGSGAIEMFSDAELAAFMAMCLEEESMV